MTIPPRIAVTAGQIADVVAAFYERARADDTLGPVFADHVTDWPTHEAKITRFWSNALLLDRSYEGNPMRVHMEAGNVAPAHFAIWLELFDAVLTDTLPQDLSRSWSALAHRIGQGLRFGLTPHDASGKSVPQLRP